MEDLLNGFLADVEEQLKEMPMNEQLCDGMSLMYAVIYSYLMQRYDITTGLYVQKKISYIEYDVTNKMRDEIFKIMDKIVDICNQKVERNEADMTDKDFKI